MIIKSLVLSNFRNYVLQEIEFHKGINIFTGDNAQGKTNILESIYLCSTNKSYRGSKDREMIRFSCDESHIKLVGEKKGIPYRIDIHLKKNHSKGVAVNAVPIRKISELLGLLHVIMFSPEDLQLIKNGPAERRRFMDIELCQLDRFYLKSLSEYNKCLIQRNAFLKELTPGKNDLLMLDVWDAQLCASGKKIIAIREQFLKDLAPIVKKIHAQLSGQKEELLVSYEPNVAAAQMEEAISQGRDRDVRMKITGAGPHRDDIRFLVRNQDGQLTDIRVFGSQGQQRTAALALKMAEIELIRMKTGDTPILLLDDVLSELDSNRQTFLLESLVDVQTILTCTGVDDFVKKQFQINQVYQVVNGTVVEV